MDSTIYINNSRVSVSPSSIGAGPIVFIVTNQATNAESLAILPAGFVNCPPRGATQPLANTGPINPQATAQVTVNFNQPGDYTVLTGCSGSTDANLATQSPIHPAVLHIGPPRPSASGELLQP